MSFKFIFELIMDSNWPQNYYKKYKVANFIYFESDFSLTTISDKEQPQID